MPLSPLPFERTPINRWVQNVQPDDLDCWAGPLQHDGPPRHSRRASPTVGPLVIVAGGDVGAQPPGVGASARVIAQLAADHRFDKHGHVPARALETAANATDIAGAGDGDEPAPAAAGVVAGEGAGAGG